MGNPCFCGCSLKTATLIIAIIDMIIAGLVGIVALIFGGLLIGAAAGGEFETRGADNGAALGFSIALFVVLMLICAFKFYLGWTLKRGSDQEDLRKCRIWFIVTSILLVLTVLREIQSVLRGEGTYILGGVFGILYEAICLWVVYGFMQELKSRRTFSSAAEAGDSAAVRMTQKV